MNVKRLLITIAVAFVFVFATDFLIHQVMMKSDYVATAELWRPETEMMKKFPWMVACHVLVAVAFSLLWAVGFAEKACLSCALKYGVTMGLFGQAMSLAFYAVMPLTLGIVVKWFFAGIIQAALLGLVVFYVYRPKVRQA